MSGSLIRRRTTFLLGAVAALMLVAPAGALGWDLPASDLSVAGQDAINPQVAIAPDGTTTVVWARYDGSHDIIQAATRPAGQSTFNAPVDLSATGVGAEAQQVAVDPDGTTTVVWVRGDGSNNRIQAATRPAGQTSFSAPQNISASGGDATYPQIAFAADGSTTVVWARFDGGDFIIQAATRAAGQASFPDPATTPPDDLSDIGQDGDLPQIAIAPDGKATVVWYRYNGSNFIIQAATRPAGQAHFPDPSLTPPENLSAAGQDADKPQIAVAPDGKFTAVWYRYNGSNYIIQSATRAAAQSTFGAPENLSETGQNADLPQVASAADGTTTVVWQRTDLSGDLIIQQSTRAAGQATFPNPSTTPPTNLSAPGYDASGAQVAFGPDGSTTVVWERYNGSNYAVQATTREAGQATFSTPVDLSPSGIRGSSAQIAYALNGSATAVWSKRESGTWIVQAASTATAASGNLLSAQVSGSGKVTSSPAGIDCGSTCSATFSPSTSVTLTATPDSGATFSGWGGECSGSQATCTLSMSSARSVTAAFSSTPPTPPTPPTPSNEFTIRATTGTGSTIRTRITVPGPGALSQRATRNSGGSPTIVCTDSKKARAAGTYTLTCRANKATRKAQRRGKIRVAIRTSYKPTGGSTRSSRRLVTLPSLKPRYTG